MRRGEPLPSLVFWTLVIGAIAVMIAAVALSGCGKPRPTRWLVTCYSPTGSVIFRGPVQRRAGYHLYENTRSEIVEVPDAAHCEEVILR